LGLNNAKGYFIENCWGKDRARDMENSGNRVNMFGGQIGKKFWGFSRTCGGVINRAKIVWG